MAGKKLGGMTRLRKVSRNFLRLKNLRKGIIPFNLSKSLENQQQKTT